MANRKQERAKAAEESVQRVAEAAKAPVQKAPAIKEPKVGGLKRRAQIAGEVPAGFHDFLKTLPKDHPFHDLASKDPEALGKEIARMKEVAKGQASASKGRSAVSSEGQRKVAESDPSSNANKAVRARRAARVAAGEPEQQRVVVQPSSNRGRAVVLSDAQARHVLEIAMAKKAPKGKKAERKPGNVATGLDSTTLFGGNIANGGQGRTKINPRRGY